MTLIIIQCKDFGERRCIKCCWLYSLFFFVESQGRIQRFWKEKVLYIGRHGWPAKKTLGVRWSKKAKIMLQTISFLQNISISIFKFSPFLYTMKACQWNLVNFSKFANALIRKEKNNYAAVNEKAKAAEQLDFVL